MVFKKSNIYTNTMKDKKMPLIIVLFLVFNFPQTSHTEMTDAVNIKNGLLNFEKSEADKIERQRQLILNRKLRGCENVSLALDCLNTFVKTMIFKSISEIATITSINNECLKSDLASKSISLGWGLVKSNENSILSLQNVDLTKSWLASYKLKYSVDLKFIENVRDNLISDQKKAHEKLIEAIVKNVEVIWKNEDKELKKKELHAKGLEQLKKLKPIRDRNFQFPIKQ